MATTIDVSAFTAFHVTGTDTDGRRFRRCYGADGARWAFGINLWRGSVWGINSDGSRKLLRRVWN